MIDGLIDFVSDIVGFDSDKIPDCIKGNLIYKLFFKRNNNKFLHFNFSGFLNEHIEEIYSNSMNYLMGANDSDSSLRQVISNYFETDNLILSSADILITGGIMNTFGGAINSALSKKGKRL